VGILLTLSSAWLSVQVVLGWFLTIPLIFLLIWFLVTSLRRNAHIRREWQEESEKPARVPTVAVPKRLPAALSKRNAFFALEAFAVGLFLVALLVVSPALTSPPETPNTGPQQYQAVIDGNGRLHLVWEDAADLANGSIQLTIKHRNYDGETWSQEGLVSSPRIASWIEFFVEDFGLYRSYLNSPVTLACNGGNELAAGWVQRISYDTGSACYCIFNGTEWQESQNLPNSNATDTFQLQYGNDGALYATWLEFNASEPYSSYYWWLYCWKIGEGTPPSAILERNNSQAVPRHPALFSSKEGDRYVLWEQVSPTNASSYLYFCSSQNGTWSERVLVSDPAIDLGDWDAVMTPDDSLHLVWAGWENYEAVMYYQSFHDSVWEQKIPLSEQLGGIWETQIASDSDGDLQAMWLSYHNIYPWTYYYYTCRRLHSTWQNCLPIANLGRHDGESTHLAMESATRSHVIQREPVDSSAQLVHYQLDSEFAQPIAILTETTSTLLARLKPYIIVKGLVPIIGALVFLPITVYVLRRCVARIWT
jgi:hypothetical protein